MASFVSKEHFSVQFFGSNSFSVLATLLFLVKAKGCQDCQWTSQGVDEKAGKNQTQGLGSHVEACEIDQNCSEKVFDQEEG